MLMTSPEPPRASSIKEPTLSARMSFDTSDKDQVVTHFEAFLRERGIKIVYTGPPQMHTYSHTGKTEHNDTHWKFIYTLEINHKDFILNLRTRFLIHKTNVEEQALVFLDGDFNHHIDFTDDFLMRNAVATLLKIKAEVDTTSPARKETVESAPATISLDPTKIEDIDRGFRIIATARNIAFKQMDTVTYDNKQDFVYYRTLNYSIGSRVLKIGHRHDQGQGHLMEACVWIDAVNQIPFTDFASLDDAVVILLALTAVKDDATRMRESREASMRVDELERLRQVQLKQDQEKLDAARVAREKFEDNYKSVLQSFALQQTALFSEIITQLNTKNIKCTPREHKQRINEFTSDILQKRLGLVQNDRMLWDSIWKLSAIAEKLA